MHSFMQNKLLHKSPSSTQSKIRKGDPVHLLSSRVPRRKKSWRTLYSQENLVLKKGKYLPLLPQRLLGIIIPSIFKMLESKKVNELTRCSSSSVCTAVFQRTDCFLLFQKEVKNQMSSCAIEYLNLDMHFSFACGGSM